MHNCIGDTLISRNGLHRAYSKLEERGTNPLIIQTTATNNCGRALKGSYLLLQRVCSRRTALVRRSERSPWRSDPHFREGELSVRSACPYRWAWHLRGTEGKLMYLDSSKGCWRGRWEPGYLPHQPGAWKVLQATLRISHLSWESWEAIGWYKYGSDTADLCYDEVILDTVWRIVCSGQGGK